MTTSESSASAGSLNTRKRTTRRSSEQRRNSRRDSNLRELKILIYSKSSHLIRGLRGDLREVALSAMGLLEA